MKKDEEGGIETASFGRKGYDRRELRRLCERASTIWCHESGGQKGNPQKTIYGILFGFELCLTVDLIALTLSDLKYLTMHDQTTGTSSDPDRLFAQMSNTLLVAWMVRPILVMEVITYGSILVWDLLLGTRSLLKIWKGTDHSFYVLERLGQPRFDVLCWRLCLALHVWD
jgi:hypothetical protein